VAGAQHGEVEEQRLDRFFDLHGDPARRRQVERVEQVGEHRGRALEVAPGVDQAVLDGLDGRAAEILREARSQRDEEIAVAHPSSFAPDERTTSPQRLISALTKRPNASP
jgi:hypothetical protein